MMPLHLLVHADSPENAERITRALRAGAPSCSIETVDTTAALAASLAGTRANGVVAARPEAPAATASGVSPEWRHEMNNHLGLIRMLADFLAGSNTLAAADAARVREIAAAADAAAQTLRRTKTAP